jgi:hypothetical protein
MSEYRDQMARFRRTGDPVSGILVFEARDFIDQRRSVKTVDCHWHGSATSDNPSRFSTFTMPTPRAASVQTGIGRIKLTPTTGISSIGTIDG